MNVTLDCGQDDLTMWFVSPTLSFHTTPVDGMPQCEILIEHPRTLCGFRFRSDLAKLCPYELAASCHFGWQVDSGLFSD